MYVIHSEISLPLIQLLTLKNLNREKHRRRTFETYAPLNHYEHKLKKFDLHNLNRIIRSIIWQWYLCRSEKNSNCIVNCLSLLYLDMPG